MPAISYYKRPDGSEPAREWIKAEDNSIRPDIYDRIGRLEREGLQRLGTNMLDVIRGGDKGLYELRNRTLKWRLAFYHDLTCDTFVLLCGWRKTKDSKKREIQRAYNKARSLLHEYLGGNQ